MYHHPGKRPVYINLAAFRFPLNAYISILHRITGVFLVIGIVLGLIWLNVAILNPAEFTDNLAVFEHPFIKFIVSGVLLSLLFHWLSGVRHLLVEHDCMQILSVPSRGKVSAQMMLVLFALGSILVLWGVWL